MNDKEKKLVPECDYDYTKYFDEEYINQVIQGETCLSPEQQIMLDDTTEKEEALSNAICFLKDFNDNDAEDDDPDLEDRKNVIGHTIIRLCEMLVLERNKKKRLH